MGIDSGSTGVGKPILLNAAWATHHRPVDSQLAFVNLEGKSANPKPLFVNQNAKNANRWLTIVN